MHALYPKAASLTQHNIAVAIEVHKEKGPGLLESVYEWCLMIELQLRGYSVCNQRSVKITYKAGIQK